MSGGGYGPIMDIVIGIIGAVLGGFLMRTLGFAGQGGLLYTILVAVIGASPSYSVVTAGYPRTSSSNFERGLQCRPDW